MAKMGVNRDELILLLREVWKKYPDLRLSQLIVNIVNPSEPCPEIYYTTDKELFKLLEKEL